MRFVRAALAGGGKRRALTNLPRSVKSQRKNGTKVYSEFLSCRQPGSQLLQFAPKHHLLVPAGSDLRSPKGHDALGGGWGRSPQELALSDLCLLRSAFANVLVVCALRRLNLGGSLGGCLGGPSATELRKPPNIAAIY